jgi:beta-lactamase regulating signal transducer with metallopeptidase domain
MNPDLTSLLSVIFLRVAVDSSIKALIVLIVAGIALRVMRSLTASTHATALTWVAITLTALPLLSTVEPVWGLPLLQEIPVRSHANATDNISENNQLETSHGEEKVGPVSATRAEEGLPSWPKWVVLTWALGAVVYLSWLLVGRVGLWWILRRAQPLEDEDWQRSAQAIAREMGIRPEPTLDTCNMVQMAVTAGALKPRVVLPAQASSWSAERRDVVLVHELSHIQRRDGLTEVVARTATALHWFNPLVWLAMRQLRIERERACDNAVLIKGAKPSDYASQLMETAAEMGAFRQPIWQTAAASEGSGLKDRLLCILDPNLSRGPSPPYAPFLTAALTIVLVAPLAAMSVWSGMHETSPPNRDGAVRVEENPGPRSADLPREISQEPPGQNTAESNTEELVSRSSQTKDCSEKPATQEDAVSAGSALKRQVARLRRDLDSPDRQVRISATVRLKELQHLQTVPTLIHCLDDSYEEVRITAVIALGAIQGSKSTEGLKTALRDSKQRIRIAAVAELGKRTTPEAYDALVEASHNSDWFVRDAARAALNALDREMDKK